MDIQLEKNSSSEALIKINLKEADYQPKYKEKLNSYRKEANIKGFRPGKVPVSLIEKMYGKSIMVEEINKTVKRVEQEKKLLEELDGREVDYPDGPVVAEKFTPAHRAAD